LAICKRKGHSIVVSPLEAKAGPTILKKQTQNSSRLDHKLTKREQEKKKREKKGKQKP
jgi:hypothetical protein